MKYIKYVTDSLYGAIYKILKDIEYRNAEDYVLYISFLRNFPGVVIQSHLEDYSKEDILTIVLENQFWNLHADYFGFKVTVLLNDEYCDLYIPYKAVTIFSDPKKDFLLDFQRNGNMYEELNEENGDNKSHKEDESIIEVDFND